MRDANGRFVKGTSGNPKGKPPGKGKVAALRAKLEPRIPALLDKVTESAMAGDIAAARLLLERVIPPLKPEDQPVVLDLSGQLGDDARATLKALGDGQISPGAASAILAGLGSAGRAIELSELEERLAALEARQ
jgi:hypothetical protein